MPSKKKPEEEDPRLVELAALNSRLNTVKTFLKSKHTSESLDAAVRAWQPHVGDHSPSFVQIDNAMVRGTRHMDSLLHLTEAMEIRMQIGQPDRAVEECVMLLERKVELLEALSKTS